MKTSLLLVALFLVTGIGLVAQRASNSQIESTDNLANRKGFILGFGVGSSLVIPTSPRDKELALITDFKIGAAISDQVMIYWSSKVNWYNVNNSSSETIEFFGNGGAGATYFLSPKSQSGFVSAGVGYSNLGSISSTNSNAGNNFGLGGFLGIGIEFAKHWTFQGDAIWGNASSGRSSQSTIALAISINYLLY